MNIFRRLDERGIIETPSFCENSWSSIPSPCILDNELVQNVLTNDSLSSCEEVLCRNRSTTFNKKLDYTITNMHLNLYSMYPPFFLITALSRLECSSTAAFKVYGVLVPTNILLKPGLSDVCGVGCRSIPLESGDCPPNILSSSSLNTGSRISSR